MYDQSSIESSVDNMSASYLQHPFDHDSDCESIESTPSRKKSSGGRGDTSVESPWISLEDHGHFSSDNASDNESLLCEADSLLFRRLSPRRRKESSSMNNGQRICGEKSQRILHSPRISKEHIPQFAVVEWDEELMKRLVLEPGNSSSEEGSG